MKVEKATIELALKWVSGSITTTDVRKKLGYTQTAQTTYKMGAALREAFRSGKLKLIP